ncbi:MAG: M23 family metallopeptidase [Alistipes sp.]|nr:M23 family metallopeptidase [Alistipes sp.]
MATTEKHESRIASFFRKRRLSVLDATDRSEEWYIHLSPAGFMAALVAVVIVLFIGVSILVSYTPLLEFIPGYRANANRSREGLIANIMRMDSMERQMRDMLTYNQNIALIMDGKTPVVRTIANADSTRLDKTLVMPSYEDSLLRAQMEGDGPYSLHSTQAQPGKSGKIEMTAPMTGIVTSSFDIRQNRFGVTIAATPGAQVVAAADGTAAMSIWSPDGGYTLVVQHSDNLLSIYRHLSKISVSAGQRIISGEVLGTNGDPDESDGDTNQIMFELWHEGKPVDPESYIIFQ